MQSVKSYFNPTLFRKNITRFWPVWAVYLVAWIFALPVSGYLRMANTSAEYLAENRLYFANEMPLDMVNGFGVVFALIFGLLAAMCVFSYLYNNRSAGMIHALPLRREGLFLTNYLSGIAFFAVPHAVVLVITLLVQAAYGAVNFGALFMWFCAVTLLCFFFYSFAVFCCMFTGNLFALPFFYGILNALALGLYGIIIQILRDFLFGFSRADGVEAFVTALTPVMQMFQNISAGPVADTGIYRLFGMGTILSYAFVGVVFAALALVLYRRRHLETAGDVVAVWWVRPIFKYGVALSSAIVLGYLFHTWFHFSGSSPWSLLPWMLGCGIVGYFAAEMLLQKSFKVFSKWKGCAVFSLALVATVAALATDITGFETRVPSPDQISSVTLSAIHTQPYDSGRRTPLELKNEADILALCDLHRLVVTEQNEGFQGIEGDNYTSFDLRYTLKNGTSLVRHYDYVTLRSAELGKPGTAVSLLDSVLNRPENIQAAYGDLTKHPAKNLTSCDLSLISINPNVSEQQHTYVTLSSAESLQLYNAVLEDFAAGRLGHRYLTEPTVKEQYLPFYRNELNFNFDVPRAVPQENYLTDSSTIEKGTVTETVTIVPQKDSIATIEVLKSLGYEWGLQLYSPYNG
ncbi:MAG: hypothetical protein RR226_00300 [Oscillospiraceae bacterium]